MLGFYAKWNRVCKKIIILLVLKNWISHLTTHTHTAYYVEKLLHLFLTMLFAAPRYKILFLFFLKTSSRIIIINESQIEVKVVIGKEKVVYRRKIWFFNIDYFVIP